MLVQDGQNKGIQMLSYHSDPKLKAKFIRRVEAHRKADRLVQGIGAEGAGKEFRGCAVGCTIGTYSHAAYETELGVPIILARLEEAIFEGLKERDALEWPTRFLRAIPVGKDLSLVWPKFAHWLLVDAKDGVIRYAKTDKSRDAIRSVAVLFYRRCRGETVPLEELREARDAAAAANAAYAAAAAANAAANAAAYAAYANANAANAAANAAYAVAAAYAAANAVAVAAAYAAYANANAYAAGAASSKAYLKQANKLIELLKACGGA